MKPIKYILFYLLLTLLIYSCSISQEDDPYYPEEQNNNNNSSNFQFSNINENNNKNENNNNNSNQVNNIPNIECNANEYYCVSNTSYRCNSEGNGNIETVNCSTTGKLCIDELGCVKCEPGSKECSNDGISVLECKEDGSDFETYEQCDTGNNETCIQGECKGLCERIAEVRTYEGCEFFALDLPNVNVTDGFLSPRDAEFAVVVSNVNSNLNADVEIYISNGGSENLFKSGTISPRSLKVFKLGIRNIAKTGLAYRGFYIKSSIPVVAYQFNPLNNSEEAFSNDASLLIPVNSADTEYIVTTHDAMTGSESQNATSGVPWGAFVTVLGISNEPTDVIIEVKGSEFEPPVGTGVNVENNIIRAEVNRYQVLTVISKPDSSETQNNLIQGSGNLSGTRVIASKPVMVFAGNVCSMIPHNQDTTCCCDHLEEVMLPLSAWGINFAAPRSKTRKSSAPEPDYWRITASKDGTTLQYFPNTPTGAPQSLNATESIEFKSNKDFIVTASSPIMLTQFLSSAYQVTGNNYNERSCSASSSNADEDCTNQSGFMATCSRTPGSSRDSCLPVSDPAMTFIPPMEQYRMEYVFLTPNDYLYNYANIVAPEGTEIVLDGNQVTEFETIAEGSSGRIVKAQVPLSDGTHVLLASNPVGLIVFGYDYAVSYAYPGGLNISKLGL